MGKLSEIILLSSASRLNFFDIQGLHLLCLVIAWIVLSSNGKRIHISIEVSLSIYIHILVNFHLFQLLRLPAISTVNLLNIEVTILMCAGTYQLHRPLDTGSLDVLRIETHIPVTVS